MGGTVVPGGQHRPVYRGVPARMRDGTTPRSGVATLDRGADTVRLRVLGYPVRSHQGQTGRRRYSVPPQPPATAGVGGDGRDAPGREADPYRVAESPAMGRIDLDTDVYGVDPAGAPAQLEQRDLRPPERCRRQYQGDVFETAGKLSGVAAAQRPEPALPAVRTDVEHVGDRRYGLPGDDRVGGKPGVDTGGGRGHGAPVGGGVLEPYAAAKPRIADPLGMRLDRPAPLLGGGVGEHGERHGELFPPGVRTGETGRERQTFHLRAVVRDRDVQPAGDGLRGVDRFARRL